MSGRAKSVVGGILAVALAAGLCFGAASAHASKVVVINTFVDSDPGSYSADTHRCPPRFRNPLSGGFAVRSGTDFQGQLEQPTVSALRLLADRRRWAMQLAAGTEDSGATLYTLCANRDPHIKVAQASTSVDPGETFTLQARCPGATRPVSSGWRTTGSANYSSGRILITELRGDGGRGWRLSGYHVGSAPSGMRLYAYCSNRVSKMRERSAPVPELLSRNRAQVKCRRGRIAYAAGFTGTADPGTETAIYGGSLEPDLALAPNYFRVSLLGQNRQTGTGVGHVYCGSKKIRRKPPKR